MHALCFLLAAHPAAGASSAWRLRVHELRETVDALEVWMTVEEAV